MALVIEPDVFETAKHLGCDPNTLQAVVRQEGNILKAVQCSPATKDAQSRQEALDVAGRSLNHRLWDFVKAKGLQKEFVTFFGGIWAPVGVANDPHHLNENWIPGVLKLLGLE